MFVLYFITIMMSLSVKASILVKSQIHSIDIGKKNEETLIFLTTGQVLRIDKSEGKKTNELTKAKNLNKWIHFHKKY